MTTLIEDRAGQGIDGDRDGAAYRVTLRRVTRSEWTKLLSLRSTWIVLVAMAVVTVGIAAGTGWAYEQRISDGEVDAGAARAVGSAFLALELAGLVIGVLGVLQMSGEYSSGLIRASLAAVPRRLQLLWAKALVLIGLTFPFMVLICLASFETVLLFAPSDHSGLADDGVVRAIVGAAAYPVGIGLLGLAIGTLIRHTAGAVTTLVVTMLVVPAIILALPEAVRDAIGPYLPITAGQAMFGMGLGEEPVDMLSPGAGAVVMLGWIAVLLGAAAVLLRRRDA